MPKSFSLDTQTWPARGRVGYRRAGEAAGSYIFLHLAIAVRSPAEAFLQAFFAPCMSHDPNEEIFVDHASGIMQDFVDESKVVWAPEDSDDEAESRLFGLRRFFGANGSPNYAADAQSSVKVSTQPEVEAQDGVDVIGEQAVHFGRISDLPALGLLTRKIRVAQGRSILAISEDSVIGARGITPEIVALLESGEPVSTQELIFILEALDYSLAILPKRGSVALQDGDPWAEFRAPV